MQYKEDVDMFSDVNGNQMSNALGRTKENNYSLALNNTKISLNMGLLLDDGRGVE